MVILEYEKLNKKAIKCMFLGTLIQFIIASTILTVIGWFFKGIIPMIIQYIILGLIILNLIYLIVSPKVRYERYRYCITKDKIDVKEGFIFIERNIVPIERLHKISIEKGPIYSIFGLSKVIVTTAGGDINISFLEDDKADFIAESLKNKINEISISQKSKKLEDINKSSKSGSNL